MHMYSTERGPKTVTSPVAMNNLSTQIVICKYYVLLVETKAPWRNGWFHIWNWTYTKQAWNILTGQIASSYQRLPKLYQKEPEANVKRLPLAKDRTTWAPARLKVAMYWNPSNMLNPWVCHYMFKKLIGLEIIILSEVSQKEKDKYHMISLICGI